MVRGHPVPEGSEEILLYQTLVGAWPLEEAALPAFRERLRAYAVKAAREAAVHTSWLEPDAEHERALVAFVDALLTARPGTRFRGDFVRFTRRIARYGAWGALGQVLLKIAAPGIPDFYQGAELWDFRLVDPDNRGPVDFAARVRLLEALRRRAAAGLLPLARDLLRHWEDGRIKLYLTWRALAFRRQQRDLFAGGAYLPLTATGARRENVFAFARRHGRAWAAVAVPRLLTGLAPPGRAPVGRGVWGAAALALPGGAPERWANVLTGETLEATMSRGARRLPLDRIFRSFPVALLESK
jgi:(1->4)-alpha-D-glucan 1-alpha-D-glucosylmutase